MPRSRGEGREREKESRAETGRGPALLLLIIIFIHAAYVRTYVAIAIDIRSRRGLGLPRDIVTAASRCAGEKKKTEEIHDFRQGHDTGVAVGGDKWRKFQSQMILSIVSLPRSFLIKNSFLFQLFIVKNIHFCMYLRNKKTTKARFNARGLLTLNTFNILI